MLKIIILIIMIPTPALAYIDPGTGSIIISFLVGIITATFFYIKGFWLKIKNFFTKKKTNQ
jgi:hypothetical protein|tara:strand:+ start:313 stop:495 length:183 start_codon:yes stop_codon:yes gene_type:complete